MDPQTGAVSGTLGGLVVHSTYDGLGRLIARRTPWDSGRDSLRLERFCHDGARRIQEVVSTEVPVSYPLPAAAAMWPTGEGRECGLVCRAAEAQEAAAARGYGG